MFAASAHVHALWIVESDLRAHECSCVFVRERAASLGVCGASVFDFKAKANETQDWGKADKTYRSQVVNGLGEMTS